MSLASRVSALATRIATEMNTKVSSSDVDEIVTLTQTQYDALGTPDPNILYIITGP